MSAAAVVEVVDVPAAVLGSDAIPIPEIVAALAVLAEKEIQLLAYLGRYAPAPLRDVAQRQLGEACRLHVHHQIARSAAEALCTNPS